MFAFKFNGNVFNIFGFCFDFILNYIENVLVITVGINNKSPTKSDIKRKKAIISHNTLEGRVLEFIW